MTDVVLRAATVDDAAALSALDVDIWRASYRRILSKALLDGLPRSPFHDPQYFLAIVDRSGMDEWLWVVEAGDVLAGYCHFGACRDPGCGYLGEIERLFLRPAIQGQGIGTRILGAAAHRLVDEGLVPIRTTVSALRASIGIASISVSSSARSARVVGWIPATSAPERRSVTRPTPASTVSV